MSKAIVKRNISRPIANREAGFVGTDGNDPAADPGKGVVYTSKHADRRRVAFAGDRIAGYTNCREQTAARPYACRTRAVEGTGRRFVCRSSDVTRQDAH